LLGRRILVAQDDNTVLVALVEHVARVQHAVAGRDAFFLVDNYFHRTRFPSRGVTGANHSPTIASMSPAVACRQPDRGMAAPSASARCHSAHVCIRRLRAMMLRSAWTAAGRSGRHRLIPSITCTSEDDARASLTTIL